MDTLEVVMGLVVERTVKILDSADIDFLITLLGSQYEKYIKNDSGTGIHFLSEKQLFRMEDNLIQISQKDQFDVQEIFCRYDKIVRIAEHFKAKPKVFGIKLIGLKNVERDAYQSVLKDTMFNAGFTSRITDFSDILRGVGIRMLYKKGKWEIVHIIEPYYKEKNNIYEQIDGNIYGIGQATFADLQAEIDTILNIYGTKILD